MLTAKAFIERFICKSGESVKFLEDNTWEIHKWTARTFRIISRVTVTSEFDVQPSKEILKLKLTPNALRKELSLSDQSLNEAIQKGWLVKETKLMSDSRTSSSIMYRMGPGLYEYNRLQQEFLVEKDILLRGQLRLEIEETQGILPTEFLENMLDFVDAEKDDQSWQRERIERFCHFLIAYLQLRRRQSTMEFKEIGATYYKKIGGSKVFDSYRDVFIERIEKWAKAPVLELGIVSMGKISSIYFTGNLEGTFSTHKIGTVQSVTDIALMDDQFHTDANTLWLVENRAVLTRMSRESGFLKESNSFVMGIDGQISGAHLKLIRMLCGNSSIQKVMIWVDYDASGQIIAKHSVDSIGDIPYVLIGNEENLFTSYVDYLEWSKTVQQAEQEMTLGGVLEWKKMLSL